VALGGGHGLYTSLTALRALTDDVTAIVTVADDGGSSGRLRDEMGILPPGDLRMALSALCEDTEWGHTWRDVLQLRFDTEGPLDGHAMGNLLIAALWTRTGDIVEGLDWVGKLLRARGRVLPLAAEPLEISATVRDVNGESHVHGQVAVASARGRVTSVEITPANPRVPAATLAAIADADLVVLGPGSWYTSVLTHFLVEPVAKALVEAGPRTVVALNIAHEDPETAGTGRADDVRALRALAPSFVPAMVLVDAMHADDSELMAELGEWGVPCVVGPMLSEGTTDRHDPVSLASRLHEASLHIARHARNAR
jgi:uncharacterized cofD-like protein